MQAYDCRIATLPAVQDPRQWLICATDSPRIPMKRLCKAPSLPDAHILLGVLEDAGIEAHVFNQNASSGAGQLPVTEACPEIWLARESDFDRAKDVVRRFEQAPRVTATTRCGACGEDSPANFQVCWNCGAGL